MGCVEKYSEQFNKQYILYGFEVKLEKKNNPIINLDRIIDELRKGQFSFEEFLKKGEEKKIEP